MSAELPKENANGLTYDDCQQAATLLAQEGKYEQAEQIVELMAKRWPQRILTRKVTTAPNDPALYREVLAANNKQETDPGFPGGTK